MSKVSMEKKNEWEKNTFFGGVEISLKYSVWVFLSILQVHLKWDFN